MGSSPSSGSRLPFRAAAHDQRMSEQTDATEDRDDEDVDDVAEPDADDDEPQPWAKALPGNED